MNWEQLLSLKRQGDTSKRLRLEQDETRIGFEVDYDRSKSLFDMLPKEIPKIAESGLSDWETVVMLHDYGFRGFLIGEQFMKNEDPGKSCQELIDPYMKSRGRKQIVK